MRQSARIINLLDPNSPREPALARDSVYRPCQGGRVLTNEVNLSTLSTVSIVTGAARITMLEVPTDTVISAMTTEVTTAAGGVLYRTALYRVDANYYPTSLVAEGGTDQSAAALGLKTSTFSGNVTLRAGVYALLFKTSGTVILRGVAAGGVTPILGRVNAAGYAAITGYAVPFNWVANTPFPNTFPTGLAITNGSGAVILHALASV